MVHPVESLASSARRSLRQLESDWSPKGQCFGLECAAVNVVYAVSKLRYKQGNGDPLKSRICLHSTSVPASLFVRHVGNRLHVLFHFSGGVVYARTEVLNYLRVSSAPKALAMQGFQV